MVWYEWIPVLVGVVALLTAVIAAMRFLIKYHVKESMEDIKHELKPNGGSSIKDQVTRLELKQLEIAERQHEDDEKFDKRLDKLESKVDDVLKIVIEKLSN
jgi:hypothetical protein